MNLRRNRIGTRTADLWSWNAVKFSQLEGPLAVQEYIQQNISTLFIKRNRQLQHQKNNRNASRMRKEYLDFRTHTTICP